MNLVKSWNQWQFDRGQDAGNLANQAKNLSDDLFDAAGEMVCNLHNKHPDKWFIPHATRGFLTSVCAQGGLPTPTPNRREGGHCPVSYRIIADWKVTRRFQQGQFDVTEVLTILLGPIDDVILEAEDGQNVLDFQIFARGSDTPVIARVDQSSGVGYVKDSETYRFERVDGQPDVCENGSGYPDSGDVNNNDLNNTVNVNITNNNGDVIGDTNIDITANYDGNDFTFPVTISGGGISIDVDVNGFTWNTTNNNSSGDGGGDGGGGGSGGGNNDTFDENDFTEVDKDGNDIDTEEPPPEEEIEEEKVKNPDIAWVLISITTFPSKGKTILQKNAANNDYFAGYFHWIISANGNDYCLPAIPIRKQFMAVKSPSDSLGYTAYTVNGAKIITKLYKQKVEEES